MCSAAKARWWMSRMAGMSASRSGEIVSGRRVGRVL